MEPNDEKKEEYSLVELIREEMEPSFTVVIRYPAEEE